MKDEKKSKKKSWWQRYIERLKKATKDNPIDCCGVKRNDN